MNTSREWPVLGKTGLRDFSARDIGVVVVTYASASTIEACLFRLLAGRDVARGGSLVSHEHSPSVRGPQRP